MNENYWPNYYEGRERQQPSPFAERINKWIGERSFVEWKILDIGCGDGRDAALFAATGKNVCAIDPNSDVEIDGVYFEKIGVAGLKKFGEARRFDLLYARWFFHAITDVEQEQVIDFAQDHCGYIAAEFRVPGDEPDDTHERRLIDPWKFAKKLDAHGFRIIHLDVDYGFSKRGDDDPYLARVIAERK